MRILEWLVDPFPFTLAVQIHNDRRESWAICNALFLESFFSSAFVFDYCYCWYFRCFYNHFCCFCYYNCLSLFCQYYYLFLCILSRSITIFLFFCYCCCFIVNTFVIIFVVLLLVSCCCCFVAVVLLLLFCCCCFVLVAASVVVHLNYHYIQRRWLFVMLCLCVCYSDWSTSKE